MAILNANALQLVQEAVTAANADILAATKEAVRLAIEDLFIRLAYTGDGGTLTSDPPNDTTGVLTDSAGVWNADEHNGRQVVICSGAAVGNIYDIDDTTGTTLVCSGDNLYADGVRSGDAYKILYQFTSCAAHLHDGINGALVAGPPPSVLGYQLLDTWIASYTNATGQSGPTGYSYHRIMAWKTGRSGVFRVRHSVATGSAGGCTFRGILAMNGSPVGAHLEQWIAADSSFTFNTQSTGAVNEGDVIEIYGDTTALATGCTWTAELMTDNPAFGPTPLLGDYL